MEVFTFIVIVVLIGCGSGVISTYLKTRSDQAHVKVDDSVYEEMENLRERVEVLERILTDEKYNLKRELDHLERSA